MPTDRPQEPWYSFLSDLDSQLDSAVDVHCLGGFVISQYYGRPRETADLDVLTVLPREVASKTLAMAGRGSCLHQTHRVYLDPITVVNHPDQYESRLIRIFPRWPNLRLWALEPHDLALTKLERSQDRDIRDVLYLAGAGLIRPNILLARFEAEWEPYVTGRTPTWHRTTLQMWMDACWPK
jgi:hypothetical protein